MEHTIKERLKVNGQFAAAVRVGDIEFDIHGEPPSLAELEQEQGRQDRRRTKMLRIGGGMAAIQILVFIYFYVTAGGIDVRFIPIQVVALWLVMHGFSPRRTYSPSIRGYSDQALDEIQLGYVDRTVQAIEATPEGMRYRDKVVAQGRTFVIAELALFEQWVDAQRRLAGFQKMYASGLQAEQAR